MSVPRHFTIIGLWLCGLLTAPALTAQAPPGQPRSGERYWVEAGVKRFELDSGFAPTTAGYIRAHIDRGFRNAWDLELVQMDRFDDRGVLGVVTNTHDFTPDLFTRATISTSSDGLFFPELRAEGSVNLRTLPRRNLILTAGMAWFDARDIHTDTSGFVEAVWYINENWVVQGGGRLNISSPGSVDSLSGYGAVTWGRDRKRYLTARVGGGNQAWQAFANDDFQVDFPFSQVTLTWREWIGDLWGVNVVLDSYHSEPYDQYGVEFGLFREF